MVLVYIYMMTDGIECFNLIGTFYIFLWNVCSDLYVFLNGLFSYLHIKNTYWDQVFCEIYLLWYFLSVFDFFVFLKMFFLVEILNFVQVSLIRFLSFMVLTVCIPSKKSLPVSRSQETSVFWNFYKFYLLYLGISSVLSRLLCLLLSSG